MWLSYTHKKYILSFLFFFMWFITGYWIQFFTLYSRTLLIIPLFAQLPVLPSPHPSSWQPHVWILFDFGWTLTSPAAYKTTWYLTKEGNKTKNSALYGYWGESSIRAQADRCVSDSPRVLMVTAISHFKRTQWVHLLRPGSWVMSSRGCISWCLIEEMIGLAWHRQYNLLEWFRNQ